MLTSTPVQKIYKPIRLFWYENYAERPISYQAAIENGIRNARGLVSLYPGDLYEDVQDLIGATYGFERDQIILGHGVEGLIHLIYKAYLGKRKTGGTISPSFFVFDNNLARCKSVRVPAKIGETLNFRNFLATIKKTDVFFLASPNKETGNYLLTIKQIETILKTYNGLLVVDECYFGFGLKTVLPLVNKYKNLLVLRSITKAEGLGGLRIGFGIGNRKIIEKIRHYERDIEYDPINVFSLCILRQALPLFPKMWKISRKFYSDFYSLLKYRFPKDKITKALCTHHFFDISRYKVPEHKIISIMNENGYMMTTKTPVDNKSAISHFPGILALTPPPREFWEDYVESLELAVSPNINADYDTVTFPISG